MEWININDRLPDNGQKVLVFAPIREKIMVCKAVNYDDTVKNLYFDAITARDSTVSFTYKVTHWMPLPEFPKEDKREK